MSVSIPARFLQQILLQSEKDYPHETCGILLGPRDQKEKVTEICPCKNVQDEYHTQDPVSFPRTARTAYFIEPRQLLLVQRQAREKFQEVRIIYHSHMNAGAYFSEEDAKVAAYEGEPAYPGVDYLVISVMVGKVKDCKLFHWDPVQKRFVS